MVNRILTKLQVPPEISEIGNNTRSTFPSGQSFSLKQIQKGYCNVVAHLQIARDEFKARTKTKQH